MNRDKMDRDDEYCQKCLCFSCLNDTTTCGNEFGTILPCRDCDEEGCMISCDDYVEKSDES